MEFSVAGWLAPPHPLVLANGDIHIWRAILDVPLERMPIFEQTLADDERTRAAQFRFANDRHRFVAARGLLRTILSNYVDREPHALRFTYNQYGKPALVPVPDSQTLFFNVAHSHGMALYAITQIAEVGVDLEYIRPDVEYEQLAQHFFSPYEVQALRTVPKHRQQEAFFNCWTRKEAYIKARGMGLSLDLNTFDVSLAPGVSAAILQIREAHQDAANWSLSALYPAPSYAAALAIEAHPHHLSCWQWPL